ncbi:Macf1: Microtubule-actin cross-linking factor 1 [Crotalus adamanteus]|uniref:Macf1: Microtubule-actin cross-linking factor 1 n=1 Tax=Crotalus adamanteus TaxID=8729 RepID=A0AAW1AZD8_CROAD
MSSSDEETLSERSYRSEPSCKSERSYRSERSGSLSPCPPGDTLPWNLPLHEQKKRKSQDSILDPAERAVVRVAGKENSSLSKFKQVISEDERSTAVGFFWAVSLQIWWHRPFCSGSYKYSEWKFRNWLPFLEGCLKCQWSLKDIQEERKGEHEQREKTTGTP